MQPPRRRGAETAAERILLFGCALTLLLVTPARAVDFVTDIKPIFAQNCYQCHGGTARKSGLRLDYRDAAFKGGELSDKVIVPGKSAESELIRRVSSKDDTEVMPPKGDRLTAAQIALLREWIDSGANWPVEAVPLAPSTQPEHVFTEKQRSHWVFQPVKKSDPPAVQNARWAQQPIDNFVLAKLEQSGLAPAPQASKLDLIRRVSYDVTGLPPSPAEIDAFLADKSADAYEKMVDSYLASPRYGEKFGQLWLDLVRFAESEGFEYDTPIGSLWKYRDYVIESLNADTPYDQFITEQIAGDEIDPNNPTNLVAAGFHRLGPVRRNKGNQDVASSRNEVLTDRTDIVGAAFMGLTMGCARCHDHKFDAIAQKDYYRLQAFMAATDELDIPLASPEDQDTWKTQTRTIQRQLTGLNRQLTSAPDDQRAAIKEQIEKLEDTLPAPLPGINTITDISEPTPIHVLARGDYSRKGDAVGMRIPSVLATPDTPELPVTTPHPRVILAKWLTDPSNPLTARVMVNRIWQSHFGIGIVKTANDFGINGERPTHPELLDYLASLLIEGGWKIKPIHRMILLSSTYRQSATSAQAVAGMEKDPDDRLLWKFPRRRLTAEELRDSMLAASGRLNLKIGGESVFIPVDSDLPKQLYKPAQWAVTRDVTEHDRRSIYLVAKRNLRLPSMEVFDQPTLGGSCPRRETSTHAPQALELLNGTMSNDLAASLAKRLETEAGSDHAKQVELAFRFVTGRQPTEQEKKLGVEYLQGGSLKEFSLAMFNLNAFLYVN